MESVLGGHDALDAAQHRDCYPLDKLAEYESPNRALEESRPAAARPPVVGVLRRHRARRGPAGAPASARHATSAPPRCATEYGNPCTRFCPAAVYEMVDDDAGGKKPADQRRQLRALQDLRHQGPVPDHRLGDARRRLRSELPAAVTASRRPRRRVRRGDRQTRLRSRQPRNLRQCATSSACAPNSPRRRPRRSASACCAASPVSGNGAPKGVYLWGGVGRGKTWLMDLFYASLTQTTKRRTHFYRFMHDVHADLKRLKGKQSPLDGVADKIAKKVARHLLRRAVRLRHRRRHDPRATCSRRCSSAAWRWCSPPT